MMMMLISGVISFAARPGPCRPPAAVQCDSVRLSARRGAASVLKIDVNRFSSSDASISLIRLLYDIDTISTKYCDIDVDFDIEVTKKVLI